MSFLTKILSGLFTGILTTSVLLVMPCMAESTYRQVHDKNVQAVKSYQKAQKLEDNWAEEKSEMELEINNLESQIKSLRRKKKLLKLKVDSQLANKLEAEREIAETNRIVNGLQLFLESVIEQIEKNIQRGLPFLAKERSERIREVKAAMLHPNTSLAEKCRRVMEILKIETDYGNTAEVYQEIISIEEINSNTTSVDILRVGGLSLFWRTPDGKYAGHWNHADKKWELIGGSYVREINDAADMVLKHRSIELVKLPIGRLIQR